MKNYRSEFNSFRKYFYWYEYISTRFMENPTIFSIYHLVELFYPYESLFSNGILHLKGKYPTKWGYILNTMVYHMTYMDIKESKPLAGARLA